MPEPIHPRELTPSMCGKKIAILDEALRTCAVGTLIGYRIEVERHEQVAYARTTERIEVDLSFGTIRLNDRNLIEIVEV